jgi:hypothetical protein
MVVLMIFLFELFSITSEQQFQIKPPKPNTAGSK